jgi:hypothetical protein
MAVMLGTGLPAAWLLPSSARGALARVVARLTPTPARTPIPPGLLALLGGDEMTARRRLQAAFYQDCLLVLRSWAPWSGTPQASLSGVGFLHAALGAGHGAIVWVQDAAFAPLVAKVALAGAGLRAHHLSRRSHRFSDSRFGTGILNPVQTRMEDRYIASRVVIEADRPLEAMLRVRRLLSEGRLVSITAGGVAGDWLAAPFMGSTINLPSGPLRLSMDTGAPLVPMFITRDAERFECHLEAPLRLAADLPKEVSRHDAACEYARLLERYTRLSPELWGGWMRSSPPHA